MAKTFKVMIKKIDQIEVEVEAESLVEAIDQVYDDYYENQDVYDAEMENFDIIFE